MKITATIVVDDASNLEASFDAGPHIEDDLDELEDWKEVLESIDWGGSEDTEPLAHAEERTNPQGDVAKVLWYCGKQACGFTVHVDKDEFMVVYNDRMGVQQP